MIRTLKHAVTQRLSGGFRECRRCGTTVDGLTTDCPSCGSGDLAHYDL